MRILFITATRIGDAVLSTGLLDHLLHRYPTARFTVACGPAAAGVFERMPRLERLIIVEKLRWDAHWLVLWARTAGLWWDRVVDLRGSALSFALAAAQRQVMRGGRRPGLRLNHLGLVLALDPPPLPVVWTNAADMAVAERLMPPGTPMIGLGPTANWAGKIWPPERFAAVFRALAAGPLLGARPAIFAGPGAAEAAAAAPVLAALPGAIDLAGRLTLAEAAACLTRCRIFIGNDSGLMHLAAAAAVPTLGLFGPTAASEYAPSGRHAAAVLAQGPPGTASMAALDVASVLAACSPLLARSALPA